MFRTQGDWSVLQKKTIEVPAGAECSNCQDLKMVMRVMGYAYHGSGGGMKIAFFKIKTNNTKCHGKSKQTPSVVGGTQ